MTAADGRQVVTVAPWPMPAGAVLLFMEEGKSIAVAYHPEEWPAVVEDLVRRHPVALRGLTPVSAIEAALPLYIPRLSGVPLDVRHMEAS